jgi:ATP phosphoribosyltransferase regulatory subunit
LLAKEGTLSKGYVVVKSKPAEDRAARQEGLISHLTGAGYARAEPAILQPADVFLDLAGEDIRSRIFLTSGPEGEELCLRPEYTIPVSRAYLAGADAGKQASFSYLGTIFRQRPGAASEFVQAGIESFGRSDVAAADAEIFALALEAARKAGAGDLPLRIGDAGLFNALLLALKLPPVWMRRIRRGHMRGEKIADMTEPSAAAGVDHSGVLAALEGADKQGARALVEDLLSIAGISSVGGRSAGEIADRFLEQASMRSATQLSDEARRVIESFLAIRGEPKTALVALKKLASDAKLDVASTLDLFEARLAAFSARGVDVSKLTFAASFGRNLDYYTGFVFEAGEAGRPIVGGGRYDGLLRRLGASSDIPAVGAAIWCDRLFGGDQA